MKKRLALSGILLMFLLGFGLILFYKNRMTQFVINEESGEFYITLKFDGITKEIVPWFHVGRAQYYFFMPSCVKDEKLYFDYIADSKVVLNGVQISSKECFQWEKDKVYTMEIDGQTYQITFMKSENIPSLFIETESGSMDSIWEDKAYKEPGILTVVGANGNVQYHGKLEKVSGRGNSTWAYPKKKPYAISLSGSYPLCNMGANKEWDLLALCYEFDKIHSKIIYDLSREIGLSSTPECTWIDLYCEGEYQGLYLLTEDLASDYHDEGGYLLEREGNLEEGEAFFETQQCQYVFAFSEPSDVSGEQIQEIASFVQEIEDLIMMGDEQYKEYMDIESMARHFLMNRIVLEGDSMIKSTFYYIDGDQRRMYAGPMWDYDRAFGLVIPDYKTSIEGGHMSEWYDILYEDSEFQQAMKVAYYELLPHFERILYEDIDNYVEYIQASAEMDSIMAETYMIGNRRRYVNWDSYIKYLKFFLAGRLNYLNELWDVDTPEFKLPESTGVYHTVGFEVDDVIVEERSVLDGTCMESLPELDRTSYLGWYFLSPDGEYSTLRPVYEDMVLRAEPISEN